MNKRRSGFVAAAVMSLGLSGSALGQYDLSWNTIDGGGATFAAGGTFSLGGTIGQPDAGAMSGGQFKLTGGFWAAQPVQVCGSCDTNCDGSTNQFDIIPFVNTLVSGDGCSPCAGDTNVDGSLNQFDIAGFVECLSG